MASVRERAKGSYEITVYDGYNISGKKLRHTKTITVDPNLTTKQKEKFKPIRKDEVRIYSCGPTVYKDATIGNMKTKRKIITKGNIRI